MSFQQGHALLIGVGTHAYHPHIDVPVATPDAEAVRNVLIDPNYCGYPSNQVRLIAGADASKAGILAALDSLKEVQSDDTVFLFFACHGTYGTDGNYYLFNHDIQLSASGVKPGTGVSLPELLTKLNGIRARRLFMIFNASHAGNIGPSALTYPAEERQGIANPSGNTARALLGTGEGRILIAACRAGQHTYFSGKSKTSIFTTALVSGLKGEARNDNGTISAFGLYEHLYYEVSETVRKNWNLQQEPVLTIVEGVGSFPVALYRGAQSQIADENIMKNLDLQRLAAEIVSGMEAKKIFTQIINTGGGAFIGGNLEVGGNFIGRDSIENR